MTDLRHLSSKLSPSQRSILKPSLGFIFTGQGAQWAGMGRDLRVFDVFEQSLRDAEKYLFQLGCHWQLRGKERRSSNVSNISNRIRGAFQKQRPVEHK